MYCYPSDAIQQLPHVCGVRLRSPVCDGLPLPTGDFFCAGAALAEAPWLFSVRVWRRCAGYGMIANMVYRMGGGGTPGGWSLPVAMASARANPLQAGMAALMLCNLF